MDVPERPVDSLTAALWLLRMTGTIPIFSVVGGLLLRWVDARWITIPGLALIAIGMFQVGGWPLLGLPGWQVEISDPKLTIDMIIAGVGFGLGHRAADAPGDSVGSGGLPGGVGVNDCSGANAGNDAGDGRAVGVGRERTVDHL